MKKVKYYPDNPFDFHKKVVSSKHKGPQKNKIEALETNIEKSYKAYNEKFTNNQLGTLKPIALQPDEQEALKGLYKFNVSSTNSEQCKLCVNGSLYIDARLLWKQAIGSNCP